MQNNFIRNLLDLKGVIVKKVSYKKNFVKIHIEMPVREQSCPCCKAKTTKIKDYIIQTIKDIPIRFKTTYIYLTESVDTNVKIVVKPFMNKSLF